MPSYSRLPSGSSTGLLEGCPVAPAEPPLADEVPALPALDELVALAFVVSPVSAPAPPSPRPPNPPEPVFGPESPLLDESPPEAPESAEPSGPESPAPSPDPDPEQATAASKPTQHHARQRALPHVDPSAPSISARTVRETPAHVNPELRLHCPLWLTPLPRSGANARWCVARSPQAGGGLESRARGRVARIGVAALLDRSNCGKHRGAERIDPPRVHAFGCSMPGS